jgi:hypothetical protein
MILSFVPRKPARPGLAAPIAEPGAVIIFPGVRYEQQATLGVAGEAPRGEAARDGDGQGTSHH